MIILKNVFVRSAADKDIFILNNVSVHVNRGETTIIIGSNGAGKTTLLDVISGKIKPDFGSVFIDDIDVTDLNEMQRAKFIGRVFQKTHLGIVPTMTVFENLVLAFRKGRYSRWQHAIKKDLTENIRALLISLSQWKIEESFHKRMKDLSEGECRKIAIIMATIVKPPKILLMDELTAFLDPQSIKRVLSFAMMAIKEHKITALLTTHDPEIAREIGNKLWVLENGKIKREFGGEKQYLTNHCLFNECYECVYCADKALIMLKDDNNA